MERPSHVQQKAMLIIFVNGTGEYKIAILPAGQKMNNSYFMKCVLRPLPEVCYPQGRKSHKRRTMLYFGNAPIHSAEEFQGHLTNMGFTRMEHLPYSPDLAPCDLFLFGAMKENFSGQRFKSAEEPFLAVQTFSRGPSADFLQVFFLEWERRFRICRESGGEYGE
jgi:histone-lysine N-methyltransferase SETMAR